MKVNNYIKVLSALLIVFGYGNNGYSTEDNTIEPRVQNLEQKLKYQFLSRKNALNQSSIEQLEKDLPKMEAKSNLSQSLVALYEKVTYDAKVLLESKELQTNLKKLGKVIKNEANTKLEEATSKVNELGNTILDSFNKDDTNGCIAQLQNYIYSIKEYFSNLKNKYIEQFSDSIDDVMDSTGKNPNLSHCVERINSWCYYFDSVYNNYQKLLEIQ